MKKIITLIFAAVVIIGGLSVAADAQQQQQRHSRYSINHRERRQQRRIGEGIKSGELTAREASRLERRQYQLRRQEARYRKSGNGLSRRERYKLQRGLNHSSRRIYGQKHDKQDYRK